ncbi:fused DSP-PTPase phosphatase/NAD kinase-like protein [Tabrizicola sp.]|uniref:phosphatase domain-containing protein n=1 Tax=Tabrizicola sp. TaxID=2005166 RepID=UPI00286A9D56|nr:tyrosine-protein phosphatase [Tabrizicola sp.]
MRIRRIIRGAAIAGSVAIAALIGHLAYLHLNGNYHPVIADEVYRAAQITPAEIASYQAKDGIRSVLNLRGAFPGEEWYDQEVAASRELGITHVDFKLSASKELSDQQVERLIAVMRDMPKPMLIHCRHGADRTGLAAALYMAAIAGTNERDAESQLSLRYGHFAVPYLSDAYPMDETWERMEPKLGFAES